MRLTRTHSIGCGALMIEAQERTREDAKMTTGVSRDRQRVLSGCEVERNLKRQREREKRGKGE